MFYMVGKNDHGVWEEAVYFGKSSQFKDEIDKLEVTKIIDFKISGKTYSEKQNSLRDLAIDFQSSWGWIPDHDGIGGIVSMIGLSYGELADIQDFFEKNGRRYGLYQEFKENGIC